MGLPEKLDSNIRTQQIWNLIAQANLKGDYASSMIGYNSLFQTTKSEGAYVGYLEAARLLGYVDLFGIPLNINGPIIEEHLGHHASHLVECWMDQNDYSTNSRHYENSPYRSNLKSALGRSFLRDGLDRSCLSPDLKEIRIMPLRSIASDKQLVVFSSNTFQISPDFENHADSLNVHECVIHQLNNCILIAESELCFFEKSFYVDSTSHVSAKHHDPRNDSVILASSDQKVVVDSDFDLTNNVQFFENGIWLGQPTTSAWGHWFAEVLMRLAILTQAPDLLKLPCFISQSVPESFVEFALFLFPDAKFTRIPSGTKCSFKTVVVIPNRISRPDCEFFSLNADHLRIHCEPEVSGLLRMQMRAKASTTSKPDIRRVFLSRHGAIHRQSSTQRILELYAHKFGFKQVEMGSLAPQDQINLAVNSNFIYGEAGSAWDVVSTAADNCTRALIVHHDRPTEWSALHLELAENIGIENLTIVKGRRPLTKIGYGDKQTQDSIVLTIESFNELDSWFDSLPL